jgi:ABC-type antimicrobial peptide transport system permease subunit
MIATFAVLGFVLIVVGIYGLSSYAAVRRTREFGIRLAFGADWRDVLLRSTRGVLWPILPGVILGTIVSLVAGRVITSELYDTKANDPILLCMLAALLLSTAVLAALVGSRHVIFIDPVQALRHE